MALHMQEHQTETSQQERVGGRFRRMWRNRTVLLAISFAIVGLVVFALAAALVGGSNSTSPTPPAVGTATDTDQSIPIYPFPVDWDIWQTIALPEGGAKYGPTIHDHSVADGYADTPRSGIVAAIQLSTRAVFSVWPDWQAVFAQQIIPSPGRDLLASYHRQSNGRLLIPEGGLPRTMGFKVLSYDPSTLVVSTAIQRVYDTNYQAQAITVRWVDGTWKLQLQPTGSPYVDAHDISDLTDYVPFGLPWQ